MNSNQTSSPSILELSLAAVLSEKRDLALPELPGRDRHKYASIVLSSSTRNLYLLAQCPDHATAIEQTVARYRAPQGHDTSEPLFVVVTGPCNEVGCDCGRLRHRSVYVPGTAA